jgi:hypothetical protein
LNRAGAAFVDRLARYAGEPQHARPRTPGRVFWLVYGVALVDSPLMPAIPGLESRHG